MPDVKHARFRLIVSDLDGTLLNSDHELTPFTEQALNEAVERGVLFTVATGKTFPATEWLIAKYDIRIPVICSNGTLVHGPDGTVLHASRLPRDCAIEAIPLALAAGLTPIIYSGTGLVSHQHNSSVDLIVAHHEPVPRVIPDLEDAVRGGLPVDKIIFINKEDLPGVAAFQRVLERTFAGRAQVVRTGLISVVELSPLGVSKGTALAFILDRLDIPAEGVIAFGDNCNDLDMLRRAGVGVAMGHSPEALLEGADDVTGTNDEDGVGHALRKWVLSDAVPSAR